MTPEAQLGDVRIGDVKSLARVEPRNTNVQLRDLRPGDRARVRGYNHADGDDAYCAQLLRLGLIPETLIEVQRVAPFGKLIEIRFRGFSLAIRPAEAGCLQLDRV